MLSWDLDPVLFSGPAPLRWYGLLFSVGIVGGFLLWRWQMVRAGHGEALAARALAYVLVGVIAGGRLGHCFIYEPGRFLAAPLEIFAVWRGGMASHGATAGLLLALLVFARRNALPFAELVDRVSFGAAFAALCVRLGNFCNSEIVGRVTGGGWGVRFVRHDPLPLEQIPARHPVQLYEGALALAVLTLLLLVDRRLGEARPRGLLGALFFVAYFGGRLVVERFKEPEGPLPSLPLTMGQLLSLPLALAGVAWLIVVLRRARAS
jgi:prolipoprotein diacylglyceryl transferase